MIAIGRQIDKQTDRQKDNERWTIGWQARMRQDRLEGDVEIERMTTEIK